MPVLENLRAQYEAAVGLTAESMRHWSRVSTRFAVAAGVLARAIEAKQNTEELLIEQTFALDETLTAARRLVEREQICAQLAADLAELECLTASKGKPKRRKGK